MKQIWPPAFFYYLPRRTVGDNEESIQDLEFADEHILTFAQRFEQPLRAAGFSCTEAEILEEWHDLLSYTLQFLSPSANPYRKTCKRIYTSTRAKKDFKNILLIVERAFAFPVSAAKCERSFSTMKRIKTDSRASLGDERVENLMRIVLEGHPLARFNLEPAMASWAEQRIRRPRQKKRKRCYRQRGGSKKDIGLSSSESDSGDE